MRWLLLTTMLACASGPAKDGPPGGGGDDPPGDDTVTVVGDDSTAPADDTAPASDDSGGGDSGVIARCGDGRVTGDEACDDGPANGTTACGCAADCTVPDPLVACDDGDACTADVCLGSGACDHLGWDGDPMSLWDHAAIRDPSTLDVQPVGPPETVLDGVSLVRMQEIRYTSFESGATPDDPDSCEIRPVRLEAFLAMPAGVVGQPSARPGLVVAHGLGEQAFDSAARGPAADHGVITIAYSGPGQGASEGWGSVPDHLFDTEDHPRDSWFWEHAMAAMRALTVLEHMPEVDADRLGVTGYSGGGVATLIVDGVDDRVDMAFATSAVGHLQQAIDNVPPGWQADLLADMDPPRDKTSAAWTRWEASLDPRHYLPTAHGRTFLANGAQDQFFPLAPTRSTALDLLGAAPDRHRLLSIVDWDHGWFALMNGEAAAVLVDDAFSFWIRHALIGTSGFGDPPPQPVMGPVVDAPCDESFVCAFAQVTFGRSGWTVTDAKVRYTRDGLTFGEADLSPDATFGWVAKVPFLTTAQIGRDQAVWYAEFELRRAGQLFGHTLRVTSVPEIPAGWQQAILPIDAELPL